MRVSAELYLPYMTRWQAREAVEAGAVLLVPVATLEQHGEHLPLHTDVNNCWAVCMAAASYVDPEPRCVVAAPVWFSISPFSAAQFPGTINMREEVMLEALGDIVESYIAGGFKRIALVNGHGGGTEWMLPKLVERLNRRESHLGIEIPRDCRVITFEWMAVLEVYAQEEFMQARGNPEGCADWHSGDVETALQLRLKPELVHMDRALPGQRYRPSRFRPYDIGRSWFRQYIVAGLPPRPGEPGQQEGVSGDPSRATAEMGERVLELAGRVVGELVREFAS